MTKIVKNEKNQDVVLVDEIIFKGKRKIDWKEVEKYLKSYIGKKFLANELEELVYIGTEFPDEYANSVYSKKIYGAIRKAKANIVQVIPELILSVTNISFQENSDQKHKVDAKYGWYRCTVRFAIPTCDEHNRMVGRNYYQGRMLIRHDANGKNHISLY